MFRCQKCNRQSDKGEKPTMVVVETRPKSYEVKHRINRKDVYKTYHGTEIVKELKVCGECDAKNLQIETA